MSRLTAIINSGADPAAVSQLHLRRLRVVNIASLGMVAVGVALTAQYYLLGLAAMAVAVLGTIAVTGLNMLWMRRTLEPARHGMVATFALWLLLVLSCLYSGGFYDPNMAWLCVLPVVGTLVGTARVGWAITAVVLLTVIAFWMAPTWGYEIRNLIPEENRPQYALANRLLVVFGIGVLMAALTDAQRVAEAHLLQANVELKAFAEAKTAAEHRAQQASRAKSDFVSNMSHEIRTPLTGMMAANDLMMKSGLGEEQRVLALTMRSSAEVLLSLVNDVLDFSKIEAGKLEIESRVFDVHRLVKDVTARFAPVAEAKELRLGYKIESDVPRWLVGDSLRIQQVLSNIVNNAVKFTASGKVTLAAAVSGNDGDVVTVRFDVKDTGVGISEEARERLFKFFTQVDASTSRQFGGTGLGLAISQQLAQLMGGGISVDSEPGTGSCFHVALPFAIPCAADAHSIRPNTRDHDIKRVATEDSPAVLLADDNATNLNLSAALIRSMGYRVTGVGGGVSAVAALSGGHDYSAVLLDWQMPDLDGLSAARQIRQAEEQANSARVPIIVVTARALKGDREEAMHAGMDDYLTRPFRQEQLFDVLQRWAPLELEDRDSATLVSPQRSPGKQEEPPPSSEGWPVIDSVIMGELKQLDAENGHTFLGTFAKNFLDDAERELRLLHEAVKNQDMSEIESMAHKIAGSSGTIGAMSLHKKSKALEEGARGGQLNNAEELATGLDGEFAAVRQALAREVSLD